MMATQTVSLPPALAERVSAALSTACDMVVALEYLADQQPQDEVMAGSLYALKACVEKLDGAIGVLSVLRLVPGFPRTSEAAAASLLFESEEARQ